MIQFPYKKENPMKIRNLLVGGALLAVFTVSGANAMTAEECSWTADTHIWSNGVCMPRPTEAQVEIAMAQRQSATGASLAIERDRYLEEAEVKMRSQGAAIDPFRVTREAADIARRAQEYDVAVALAEELHHLNSGEWTGAEVFGYIMDLHFESGNYPATIVAAQNVIRLTVGVHDRSDEHSMRDQLVREHAWYTAGKAYERQGGSRNLQNAISNYELAADRGHHPAAEALRRLGRR
jgi:tetratricopeptide (TPR) repeat protein